MARLLNLNTGELVKLHAQHTIGSHLGCANIILNNPGASKVHASITWDGEHWLLQDCSRNGTYINGVRVTSGSEFRLNKGEKVNFANLESDTWQLLDEKPPQSDISRALGLGSSVVKGLVILKKDPQPASVIYQL